MHRRMDKWLLVATLAVFAALRLLAAARRRGRTAGRS